MSHIKSANNEIHHPLPLFPAYKQTGVKRPAAKRFYLTGKRMFDVAVVLALSPLWLLAIGVIALVIWLEDRHNPFFIQMRTGQHGRRFPMYKFRTMTPNAEEMKAQLMHLNELEYPDFKIKNDPRITKTGRFLRRASLDELPQLFNVLLGDMSLVGPRPTSFKPETYKSWHMARLAATPGITGLWQVSGRSDLEFDERVQLDIEYIERQTFLLDLQILWRTFSSVLRGRGAY